MLDTSRFSFPKSRPSAAQSEATRPEISGYEFEFTTRGSPVTDTDLHLTIPLGTLPASTDANPQSVVLELMVSDHDAVLELLQKPEGRERNEYALIALRIGLLSLKHARGQIDADAVRHEGERLLLDLNHALEQSRGDIHASITTTLKEYFDPQSGRFQERVDRLIKQDGELEQLLHRQIGSNGSELAATLAAHIGENSPLDEADQSRGV